MRTRLLRKLRKQAGYRIVYYPISRIYKIEQDRGCFIYLSGEVYDTIEKAISDRNKMERALILSYADEQYKKKIKR